jgi:RNA polymerase sigma-70 factor, ECF subfamily
MTADPNELDIDLVARTQDGCMVSFERLYRRHHARIYAVCLRLHADEGLAEDSLQEAFVRAWQRLGEFRGDAGFATWLHRIAVNTALGRLRSSGRRDRGLQVLGDDEWQSLAATPTDDALALDLEAAIARLPSGARVVFVLHDVEGFTHEEVASMTGLDVGTSKSQLHRARRLLRERLEHERA